MTREEAKEPLPIMQAFADGKTIQDWTNDTWKDKEYTSFGELSQSPIKPQPKYRPFNSLQEAWDEMAKHSPFAWVHYKDPDIASDNRRAILSISEDDGNLSFVVRGFRNSYCMSAEEMFDKYEFTDGEPFGIKEE